MRDQKLFEAVHKNINKFETRLEKYLVPPCIADKGKPFKEVPSEEEDEKKTDADRHVLIVEENKQKIPHPSKTEQKTLQADLENAKKAILEKFAAFSEQQKDEQPRICIWTYMLQPDVEHLIKLTNKNEIRKTIDNQIKLEYPKGINRLLAIEMMYSLVQFCQKSSFNVKQTGALLSIFYLTHQYFLRSFYTSAERTYNFFKEYMLLHCFECPPDSIQLFNYDESKHIVLYFCTIYLRNLPLIRLLTLPSFGFYVNYEKKPDLFEEKKGKEKGKGKDKGDKKKK